ncbi:MAG: hypothetical protein ACLTGI_11440 [Hoylesella buccalis]
MNIIKTCLSALALVTAMNASALDKLDPVDYVNPLVEYPVQGFPLNR